MVDRIERRINGGARLHEQRCIHGEPRRGSNRIRSVPRRLRGGRRQSQGRRATD